MKNSIKIKLTTITVTVSIIMNCMFVFGSDIAEGNIESLSAVPEESMLIEGPEEHIEGQVEEASVEEESLMETDGELLLEDIETDSEMDLCWDYEAETLTSLFEEPDESNALFEDESEISNPDSQNEVNAAGNISAIDDASLIEDEEEAPELIDEISYIPEIVSEISPYYVGASTTKEALELYKRELKSHAPASQGGDGKISKFALVYLNDNNIPDLLTYGEYYYDSEKLEGKPLHEYRVRYDGSDYSQSHSNTNILRWEYYFEGKRIIDFYWSYNIMGKDYVVSGYTQYLENSADYLKHLEWRSFLSDSNKYLYNFDHKEVTEEEYYNSLKLHTGNTTKKVIPWVENTVENRDKFFGKDLVMNPVAITAVYNSQKGGDIRWKKTEGAVGYAVYRIRSAEGTKKIATISDVNTLQCYDTDIKDNCYGRVYHYYIKALYDYNGKTLEGPASARLALQRLAPMQITSAKNNSSKAVSLTWECKVGSNKANGYEIQYALSSGDLYNRKGSYKTMTVNGRNNFSKTIKNLQKGKTYWIRIRCYVNYTHSRTGSKTKTWSQYSNVVRVKINK